MAVICQQSSFYFNMGKSYEDIYHSSPHDSVLTGNMLISIVRFARYDLLLGFNTTFMTDSQHLGTIQIWQNLNEHHDYLTSTKSVFCQIDANYSPFQSLNMVSFYIRLECLKLICNSLISFFSNYHFKIDTLCLFFLSSHTFTALEFDNNYFGILHRKIVKPRGHNEIKTPIGKILQKYKPIRYHFVLYQKYLSCSFVNKVYGNVTRYPTSKRIKIFITWKPLSEESELSH